MFNKKLITNYLNSFGDLHDKIHAINELKILLHENSPFKNEPVDCVIWVNNESIKANDYNPNTVAPPEMQLLQLSIEADGYTQPIVTWENDGKKEVIDGFHRNRVGKEVKEIKERIHGYLPVVSINKDRQDITDRMASTIRHNRARGKHGVDAMSEIVLELKNRNWTNQRISKNLGMDEDEILRLCQITGLSNLFSDDDFSRSWDIQGSVPEDFDFEQIDDLLINPDETDVRTVNTGKENRIFHTYDKWECHKAGFYANSKEGMSKKDCEQYYASFLKDENRFRAAAQSVISTWEYSCQHYLTNSMSNRIAWIGQASVCYESGIPSCFCGGFNLLTEKEQGKANNIALEYLNIWLIKNGYEEITMDKANTERQSTIY